MNTARPQIPPIPPVPIADERGIVRREWWRWFHLVFSNQMAVVTDASIALQFGLIPADPAPPVGQSVNATLAREIPADPAPSVKQITLQPHLIDTPPDPPNYREAIFRSMMLAVPADPA